MPTTSSASSGVAGRSVESAAAAGRAFLSKGWLGAVAVFLRDLRGYVLLWGSFYVVYAVERAGRKCGSDIGGRALSLWERLSRSRPPR